MIRRTLLAGVFGCCLSTSSLAQGADILGIFGGVMAAAQAQAAKEAWGRESELMRYCVQRAVGRQGMSFQRLVQTGVMPNDPRLGEVFGECARFDQAALRSGVRCTVKGDGGWSVQSRCNQAFLRTDGHGQNQPLDARAAIDLHFNGIQTSVVEIETDAGRQARVDGQQRIAEVARLRNELEALQSSRSQVVRLQSQGLIQRALMMGNPEAAPSEATLEALRREQQRLTQFERSEITRLAALERVEAAKGEVDRRLAGAPTGFRDEARRLNTVYSALLNPTPPTVATPKPAAPRHERFGPTFDCQKAKSPIEHTICFDAGLSRLDLEMVQAYYVLRHALPDQRPEFRQEMIDFTKAVVERCRLAEAGAVVPRVIRAAVPCVTAEYQRERNRWRDRVEQSAPAGREEAVRPIDEHVRLQERLQEVGYIPAGEMPDGVYGAKTRSAIATFQSAEGLQADGLLSRATAERLLRRGGTAAALDLPGVDGGVAQRLTVLHGQYVALASRLDEAEGRRTRELQIETRATEARRYIQDALSLPLRAPMHDALTAQIAMLGPDGAKLDPSITSRFVAEFDASRPAVDDAVALARATTPKNAFVFEGDPADVIVLYNDTGQAPSVVKNLRGELVFESGRTVACQPHGGRPDEQIARQLNARLERWGQVLQFPLARCSARALPTNDLVVFSRGELLKEKAEEVVALLSAVDAGVLFPMVSVTSADVRAAQQADGVRLTEVEADIEKGRPGFAFIASGNGTSVACFAVDGDREAHEFLAKPILGRAIGDVKTAPSIVTTNADAAFRSVKRGQCGAIYGSSSDLHDIAAALKRDGLSFRYVAGWVTPEDVSAAKAAIASGRTRELQQEGDRRRRLDDERRLEDEKDRDIETVRRRLTAELQAKNGAMARAIEGKLTTEFKDYVEGRASPLAMKYPRVGAWYKQMLQDRWELMTVDTKLVDYGVAEFKGRSLETGFARTTVKLRNRILGEYKDQCWVTGYIDDQEFAMDREPIASSCEASDAAIGTYRQTQRFTSRWLAP